MTDATAALDLAAEFEQFGETTPPLCQEALALLARHHLTGTAVRSSDSLALRNDADRDAIAALAAGYRDLGDGDRAGRPALRFSIGRLLYAAGDFAAAEQEFMAVAQAATDATAKGEAFIGAHRAALERQAWPAALEHLVEAIKLDGKRFAPFPVGKYHPKKILGAGGFGVAYLCQHKYLNGPVVVKSFHDDAFDRPVEQVFAEAQALRQVTHPAIIRVEDCGYADTATNGRPYMVTEYFPCETLEDYPNNHGLLEPDDVTAIARQLTESLQAAHAVGILHRDVKPGNVLIAQDTAGWHVKLIDFGQALRRPAVRTLTTQQRQTLAGNSIVGTLEYAAPEQLGKLPGEEPGPAADLYGLGRTLCYALFSTPQPLRKHWNTIPEPLANLVESCLHDRPSERPADCAAILQQLDQLSPAAPVAEVDEVFEAPAAEPVVKVVTVKRTDDAPRKSRADDDDDAPRPRKRAARREWEDDEPEERGGIPPWVWIAGGGAVAVVLLGGVLLLWLTSGKKDAPQLAQATFRTPTPAPVVNTPKPRDPDLDKPDVDPPTPKPRDTTPAPAPADKFAANEQVTVNVVLAGDGPTFEEVVEQLQKLTDRPGTIIRQKKNGNGGGEVVLAPVRDVEALAKKVKFAHAVAADRTLTVAVLDKELWAAALNGGGEPPARATRPTRPDRTTPAKPALSGDLLATTLTELAEPGPFKAKQAAERLARLDVEAKRQAEVVTALENALDTNNNHSTQISLCQALGKWGNEATVTKLIAKVQADTNIFIRRAAIGALGELNDERAAPILVEQFIDFHARSDAVTALKKLGSKASKEVIKLLSSSDAGVRREGVILLADCGTTDQIPTLQKYLRLESDRSANEAGRATLAVLTKKKADAAKKKS